MNFEDAREAPARCLNSNVLDLATGQGQDGGCGRGVAGRCAGRKKRAGPQNKDWRRMGTGLHVFGQYLMFHVFPGTWDRK
jgi:hypothetical protein